MRPPGLVDRHIAPDAATPFGAADRVEAGHGGGLGEHQREGAAAGHSAEFDASRTPATRVVEGRLGLSLELLQRRRDPAAGLHGVGDRAAYADPVLAALGLADDLLLGEAGARGGPPHPDLLADVAHPDLEIGR